MNENVGFDSVEEFFQWRLKLDDAKKKDTVEDHNREKTDLLGWTEKENNHKKTDVLYSFLLIYQLGLKVTDNNKYQQIYEREKARSPKKRLSKNSPRFLHTCSTDPAFSGLNKSDEIKEHLKLYFSIGNVIPIWPGGNSARGVMGLYDIPEIFFNIYSDWADKLIELYPEAGLNLVKTESFEVKREKDSTPNVYEGIFKDKSNFDAVVLNNPQAYFDYLYRRSEIIKKREEALLDMLHDSKKLST